MNVLGFLVRKLSGIRKGLGLASALSVAMAAAGSFTPAHAGMLIDLSTGKGLSNLQVDPNWTVSSSYFGGAFVETKVLDAAGFPYNGPWVPNSADSKWITPNDPAFTQNNAPPASSPNLDFTYRVTFNLTADQAANASLVGLNGNDARWTSDNNGLGIYLNGSLIDGTNTGNQSYHSWHSFDPILTGFHAGLNTLDFVVRNIALSAGNPTGFRTEVGLMTSNPVPEPSSVVMAIVGGGLSLGVARRQRRKAAAAKA